MNYYRFFLKLSIKGLPMDQHGEGNSWEIAHNGGKRSNHCCLVQQNVRLFTHVGPRSNCKPCRTRILVHPNQHPPEAVAMWLKIGETTWRMVETNKPRMKLQLCQNIWNGCMFEGSPGEKISHPLVSGPLDLICSRFITSFKVLISYSRQGENT